MATTLAPVREGLKDTSIPTQFKNEPTVDFSNPENARRMRAAIEKVRSELGREYDLVIGGRRVKTSEKISSLNPAKPSEIVGIHQAAGAAEVEPAMQAALKAFETWKYASLEERTGLLFRTSHLMRERKFELMAWMVFEVGKNWAEADGDIAELIDFCDFYALEAIRLSKAEPPVQLPGERDWLRYIPLGVGVVIPPWNFPGAIMGGMTLASIVCGNTVILKPSSDSPTIAAKFFEILEEAGLPDGVANFCPGKGGSFGNAVVEHPKTRYIAFTGSKEVGLHINQRAAAQQPGQIWIKRTVLEMGGKDSIVVDADADFDAAVEGVAVSAFGFSGQKCSACSRAIVDERIYDLFVQRLRERVEKITVGDPDAESRHGAGGEREVDEVNPRLHREGRRGRRKTDHRRWAGHGGRRWLLHPANGDCRRRSHGHHLAAGDFRSGAGRDQVTWLRRRAGHCQQHGVRFDRRGLYHLRRQDRGGEGAVPRRQPVHQSQVHRGHGWRASLRRLQHVGHRLQGRRPRLPAAVHSGQVDWREDHKVVASESC